MTFHRSDSLRPSRRDKPVPRVASGVCAGAIPVEGARVCGWGLGQASPLGLSKSPHVREGAGSEGSTRCASMSRPGSRHRGQKRNRPAPHRVEVVSVVEVQLVRRSRHSTSACLRRRCASRAWCVTPPGGVAAGSGLGRHVLPSVGVGQQWGACARGGQAAARLSGSS